jgi:ribosome-associated protein
MIHLTDEIVISENDIAYKFSRSTGPGGQNVNKLNTRVTLLFNVARCRSLTDVQKQKILARLTSRISDDGFLTVVSQRHRTQHANRLAAQRRLGELLTSALVEKPARKKTTIPRAAHQRRLLRKRRHSEIKRRRKPVTLERSDG